MWGASIEPHARAPLRTRDTHVPPPHGAVQRRQPCEVRRVDRHARLEQDRHSWARPRRCRHVQRRPPLPRARAAARAARNERRERRRRAPRAAAVPGAARRRRHMQRRPVVHVQRVDVRAGAKQQLNDAHVETRGGGVQRRPQISTGRWWGPARHHHHHRTHGGTSTHARVTQIQRGAPRSHANNTHPC
jgi:hypothetical protein